MIEPPVMLWVISLRPGFRLSILAGVVWNMSVLLEQTFSIVDSTCLGVFATLEERSHADEADVVIPHDCVLGVITGKLEDVLKYFSWLALNA
jgi:hypothetical protein